MYLSSSSTDNESLRKWKAKKNERLLGLSNVSSSDRFEFHRQNSSSHFRTRSASPRPHSRSSSYLALPFSSEYKYKLAESQVLPSGCRATSPRLSASLTSGRRSESEVDYLTSLLINGLRQCEYDPKLLGMCYKCGHKVIGNEGCMALNQMYHTRCFVCTICHCSLRHGTFYLVNNQPFCETDYYNSLSDCCVCLQKIQDKIIEANNKKYHARCFKCKTCDCCLDGVAFTLDNFQQTHCVSCFQRRFAPQCNKCHEPICPRAGEIETVRIVALNQNFHTRCYRCDDCFKSLYSNGDLQTCYPHSGSILCNSCYQRRTN